MANKRWENIGWHNYKDIDWKDKFRHHEKHGHGNLWGHGSWLQQQGYLTVKSKYKDRTHGNVDPKYDKRWKWNPDKDLSMEDKWALFGQVAGKSTAEQGYKNFRLKDIDLDNYNKINWERQFRNRGWWDLVSHGWEGGKDKLQKWQRYSLYDAGQIPIPEPEPEPAPEEELRDAAPWMPNPDQYMSQGVRSGFFGVKAGQTQARGPRGFFGRGRDRLKKAKAGTTGLTIKQESLNI